MDPESSVASRLLGRLAAFNDRWLAFERDLNQYSNAVSTRGAIDLRDFSTGWVLERYVEADLASGVTVCWWIDVQRRNDAWTIHAHVFESPDRDLRRFADREALSLDQFLAELDSALTGVTET